MTSRDHKTGTPSKPAPDETQHTDTNERTREISGPGASDFLTAPGGIDTPESDPAKGTRSAHEEGGLTDARRLAPRLDEPRAETERAVESPRKDKPRGGS